MLSESPAEDFPPGRGSAEQRQDVLGRLVRDRKRLYAELLLHLQCLQPRRRFFHVGVDHRSDSGLQGIRQFSDEGVLDRDPAFRGPEFRGGVDPGLDQPFDVGECRCRARGRGDIDCGQKAKAT